MMELTFTFRNTYIIQKGVCDFLNSFQTLYPVVIDVNRDFLLYHLTVFDIFFFATLFPLNSCYFPRDCSSLTPLVMETKHFHKSRGNSDLDATKMDLLLHLYLSQPDALFIYVFRNQMNIE